MSSLINLKGKTLNVATNLSPPYVFLNYESSNRTWSFSGGLEVKLLESLSKHFNFTYRIINCNSDWGVLSANHTWTGIVGKVASKEADLGFAGLTVTEERSQAVYFTHPHIISSVSFITPPPKLEPIITLVIEPFEPLVWVCIIASFILMVLTEWLISQNWTELKQISINWAIISALLRQQLSCRLPTIGPLRILLCCWLLTCLVLTASYSGCLYSLMAVPSKIKTIDTLKELANAQRNGLIQVTCIGDSSYYESLMNANFGVYQEIAEFLKPVKNKQHGLDVVRNSSKPHAYISTRDHLNYGMLLYGHKSFHLPPATEESTVFLDVMAIAIRKDFEHKNTFDKLISDIKKGGFLDYWRHSENRKIISKSKIKVEISEEESHHPLHLNQLQSAFYTFFVGKITSILMILLEIITKKLYFC